MVEAVQEELPAFPFAPGPLSGVSPEFVERRATCPFGRVRLPSGDEAVLLVTYPDVAAALADVRLSHNLTAPGSPRITAGPSLFDDPANLNNMEGEEHLRIRRIVAQTFTPRRVELWKPRIQAIAADLIDRVVRSGPPFDLVAEYCLPLPGRIICAVLGVPEADTSHFSQWSSAFVSAARMTPAERAERIAQFTGYTAGLLAQRRAEPGTGLIDELIAARDGSDRLTETELVYLVTLLVAAGNETTSNALSRALLSLLADGGALWRRLVDDPGLIPTAVDELLRYNPLSNVAPLRLATADVELPSGTVKAGQAVVAVLYSAMRDASVYQDPETVLLDRRGPALLVFGGGPHYCLGAHLAKAELQIGLGELVRRLPGLRLDAALDELRFTEGEITSSLVSLPVAW